LATLKTEPILGEWVTIECQRVMYADRGRETILCDRLPSPVTIVVELSAEAKERLAAELTKK